MAYSQTNEIPDVGKDLVASIRDYAEMIGWLSGDHIAKLYNGVRLCRLTATEPEGNRSRSEGKVRDGVSLRQVGINRGLGSLTNGLQLMMTD